jgi:hypothetical protein
MSGEREGGRGGGGGQVIMEVKYVWLIYYYRCIYGILYNIINYYIQ